MIDTSYARIRMYACTSVSHDFVLGKGKEMREGREKEENVVRPDYQGLPRLSEYQNTRLPTRLPAVPGHSGAGATELLTQLLTWGGAWGILTSSPIMTANLVSIVMLVMLRMYIVSVSPRNHLAVN